VAAVPTLKALAWNLPQASHPVCPLLDARKKEVYAAVPVRRAAPRAAHAGNTIALAGIADRVPGTVLFTGEASRLYHQELVQAFGDRALFAPRTACLPSAAAIAEIGLGMLQNGEQTDPDHLTPLYIRRPEAEVAWEKRQASL
jgi:tRNA threonylcarbamoyladenosine biosynthesis protein TsaB